MADDQENTTEKGSYTCHWETVRDPDGDVLGYKVREEGERPPHLIDPADLSNEQLRMLVKKRRTILTGEHLEIMNRFHLEFEEIWSCIVELPGRTDAGDESEWKKAALRCFDSGKRQWQWITRDILRNDEVWEVWRGGHEKGDVRGQMFVKVLESQNKKLLHPPSGGKAYGARFFEEQLKLLD